MAAAKEIIFVSGWGATNADWNPLIRSMQNNDVAFTPHFYDWQKGLKDSSGLLEKIGNCSTKPVLCGWSLGGLLALQAVADGADVAGLFMVASTARMCADGEKYPGADARAIKAMRLKLRKKPAELLDDFSRLCFGDYNEEARQCYVQQAGQIDTADLLDGLTALAGMDLREALRAISCPIHFIHATDDGVIPLVSVERVKQIYAPIHVHIFQSGGHALPLSIPDKLTELFLKIL